MSRKTSQCLYYLALWAFIFTPAFGGQWGGTVRVKFDNSAMAFARQYSPTKSPHAILDMSNFAIADAVHNSQYIEQYNSIMARAGFINVFGSEEELGCIASDVEGELASLKTNSSLEIPANLREIAVCFGDSLASLAQAHGTTVEEIKKLNQLENSARLVVGQILNIQSRQLDYQIMPGDNLWELSRRFSVDMDLLAKVNGLKNLELIAGQSLLIPGGNKEQLPNNVASSPSIHEGGRYIWPTASRRITSAFGYRRHPIYKNYHFHNGVDIAGSRGVPVCSIDDGIVIYSDWKDYSGKLVIISHLDGLVTVYAHLNKIDVKNGKIVRAGEKIGEIGKTGRATGYHLHFGAKKYGAYRNPMTLYDRKLAQKDNG